MPNAPVVRPALLTDRDQVVRMRTALWPDSTAAEVDVLLADFAGVLLVSEDEDGELIGYAEVGVRPFADGCLTAPVAYLEGVWVGDDERRSGIGAALVAFAEVWAREQGLTEMASDCAIDNTASHAFHTALGFEEAGRMIAFRRSIEPR